MGSLELSILFPALITGIMVLATHVPLGSAVLARGIIFVDLAVAQMAGLGALAASLFYGDHVHDHHLMVQACSLLAALVGSVILTWTDKHFPDIQEALIGCLFVFAASLALLLLGQNPHGGEHMKDLLAGQILWVSTPQLVLTGIVYTAVLAVWFLARHRLNRLGFYGLFAVTVTLSVQLVGVYLVFACLILPAIAMRARGTSSLWAGYGTGMVGLLGGLGLSVWCDDPTGPAIVCVLFIVVMVQLGALKLRRPL